MSTKPIVVAATTLSIFSALAAGCGAEQPSAPGAPSLVRAPATTPNVAGLPSAANVRAAVHCMRTHGVPNFPDPLRVNGRLEFGFTADDGIDPYTPAYKAADRYCGDRYIYTTHRESPAQLAHDNANAVKFSACMRKHGATDFPDPDGTGVITVPTPTYLNTPDVLTANAACKTLRGVSKGFILSVPFPVG